MNNIAELRKKVIEQDFSKMNNMQMEAVLCTEGPLLILAGAGSGKTTVLVNRIANLLEYGSAYHSEYTPYLTEEEQEQLKQMADKVIPITDDMRRKLSVNPPMPWQILAITFTNKAAKELVTRIQQATGEKGEGIWAATFHSTCARILRRFGERIGYNNNFTVYDTMDQRRLIKDCMKQLNIDEKFLPQRSISSEISRAKDSMKTPQQYKEEAGYDSRKVSIGKVYQLYEQRLKEANALDFDDLLYCTVKLFEECPDVLELYSNQFRYIMVDEYQDTNRVQYKFISMLASKHNNICVVGDDDQSIYKFRGATIENILSFEETFDSAKIIRLEQNYRSTSNILDAANSVIKNNRERKGKTLWTNNSQGEKITVYEAQSESDEARYIAEKILSGVKNGRKYSDFAILYRMNAQSNAIEQALSRSAIPHRIIGGHRFYDRDEIKDMTAYLQVVSNPSDAVRLKRIINRPKRGIGDATVNEAQNIAFGIGEDLYNVFKRADEFPSISRAKTKCIEFCKMMDALISYYHDEGHTVSQLYEKILELTEYCAFLKAERDDSDSRIENIEELKSNIIKYEEEYGEEASLEGFLEDIALITDIDNYNADSDSAVMMTIHSAKGLEFAEVFMPGMEDGIFPGMQSMFKPEDMQEERRLAYVGITRAKQKLYMIHSDSRMLFGSTQRNRPSTFLREVPDKFIDMEFSAGKSTYRSQGARFSPSAPSLTTTYNKKPQTHFTASSSVHIDNTVYSAGQRVKHNVFGEGMVISASKIGNDTLLEIAFDNVGTKKLFAKFAKLTVIS